MFSKQDKKILVVEDENSLSEVLVYTLAEEGYTVISANNGEDGLKLALSQTPDLMLVDIMMPKMDGLGMMAELKKQKPELVKRVIFFTNLNQMDKIADAINEGAAGYVIKAESSLDEIVKKVNDFFTKK